MKEKDMILTRDDAEILLKRYVKNERMLSHCYASEAVMGALAASETITGLIVATTLVYPDKKLVGVKPKSVVKRMKEKAFASSVNRDNIMECEKIGVPINEFVELSINAMLTISDRIGL